MAKGRSNTKKGLNRKEKGQVLAILNKNRELKMSMLEASNSTFVTSAGLEVFTITALSISQGDGHNSRDGEQINVRDIHVRLAIKQGSASSIYRLYAYQNMENADPSSMSNVQPHQFFADLDDAGAKYKILWDQVFTLDVDSGKSYKFANVKISGKKLNAISFNGSSTTVEAGEVHVLLTTDNSSSGAGVVEYTGKCRYYDS